MLKFVLKCLTVCVLMVAAYALWPRQPSMGEFSPRGMADLDVAAWRDVSEGRRGAALLSFYRVYEGQYRLPPVDALRAAWSALQAVSIFLAAADRADQEGALPYLENVFGILSGATGMVGDGKVAARLQLFEWMLASDSRKRAELATVVAEKLALVHGVSAGSMEPVAAPLSKGIGLRADRKWRAAEGAMEKGFELLKTRLSEKESL